MTGQIDMWRNRSAYSSTFVEDVDRLIVAGECRPVVMPMPDCWTAYGGAQFLDSAGTGSYMTYLCDELVPFVDERFATLAERDARAVQGKSSGGYGALVLPMLRPDLWGGLGDVSGDAAFEYCYLPDFPPRGRSLREHESRSRTFWEKMLADPSPSDERLRRGEHDRDGRLLLARPRRRARAAVLAGRRLAARGRLGALAGAATRCG